MAAVQTALIIDDEPHVRAFLRLVLKDIGIDEVREAGDGAEGLNMIEEREPDLVLLDVNLPQLNGLAVLERAIEARPNLIVVMVTSESAMKTVQDSVRLGASGYILKHAPKSQIAKSLREVIHESEAADEDESASGG